MSEDEMGGMEEDTQTNERSTPGFEENSPEEGGTTVKQNQGGLDVVNEEESANRYAMREVKFKAQNGQVVSFNPVVSLISIVVLWTVSIICMGTCVYNKQFLPPELTTTPMQQCQAKPTSFLLTCGAK